MDLLLGLAQESRKTLVVVTHGNNLAERGDRTLRIVGGVLARRSDFLARVAAGRPA